MMKLGNDGKFIELLENADDEKLLEAVRQGYTEACGAGPVLSILKGLGKKDHQVRVLGYSHSGEVMGDRREVVGYTSAVILRTAPDSGKGHE
ncbi:MAG: AmmeMemoRadiSam system protein B [Candidatus Marinimicrobia bacterium]|nr:AmmeMemoRadiSam system protein B [Candidatus Neomarinimicrobiota bacterium]